MKYFWLAFSFFLFTLSVYPCSDSEACEAETTISKANSHDNHSHDMEQCTPFCTCSHCPSAAFYPLPFLLDLKSKTIADEQFTISHYSFLYTKEIALKIWQPPKIS